MKTNTKENSISLKAALLSTALFLGTLPFAMASASEPKNAEEVNYQIEISELKESPTITLVDKNLTVVAQFFGNPNEVKKQFESTFHQAELLAKHNNQSIYVLVAQ
jgi:ribosome biogenesis protein Nip4